MPDSSEPDSLNVKPAQGWLLTPKARGLANLTTKSFPPAARGEGVEVDRSDLEGWLLAKIRGRQPLEPDTYFGDDNYYLPSGAEVRTIWQSAKLAELEFKDQKFDCDDFAWAMKGHASRYAYLQDEWRLGIGIGFVTGYLWRPNHAANFFIQGQELCFLEPRYGTLYTLNDCTSIRGLFL
jgi:hypothetical protein